MTTLGSRRPAPASRPASSPGARPQQPQLQPKPKPWLWVVLWIGLVVSVQPWTVVVSGPQGSTTTTANTGKGVLLGVIVMIALFSVRPGFRARLTPSLRWYLGYGVLALASSLLVADPAGPLLRVIRFITALFLLVVIWAPLLSPAERLIRAHLGAHLVLAASVLIGLLIDPGQAWRAISTLGTGPRLQGVLLPMLPPRVGEVGAILVGIAVVSWACRRLRALPAALICALGIGLLAASKTRTAAGALVLGLALALFLTRRTWSARIATLLLPAVVGAALLTVPSLQSWATRGQSADQLASLSGRTASWSAVLDAEVSTQSAIFGHGLGNKKVLLRRGEGDIDVMPIDNSWLSLYWETGVLGAALVVIAFGLAAYAVVRAPRGLERGVAAFLLGFVAVASFNESGLSDFSSMTLHLLVAAALAETARRAVSAQPALPRMHPVSRRSSRHPARSPATGKVS